MIGWTDLREAVFAAEYSFKHKDGRFCRQYYLGLDSNAFVGFACSDGHGNWHVRKTPPRPCGRHRKRGM